MKLILSLSFVLSFSILYGCANTSQVVYQDPMPLREQKEPVLFIEEVRKSPVEVFAASKTVHSEENIYYFQNYGGGGLIFGLALIPIGPVINAAMIQSKTSREAEAITGALDIDLSTALAKAVGDTSGEAHAENGIHLSPHIMIVKGSKGRLNFIAVVDAREGDWRGRYSRHLSLHSSLDELAQGLSETRKAELQASIEEGFEDAVALFLQDARGELKPVRDITFYSEKVMPRFRVPLKGRLYAETDESVTILGPGSLSSPPMLLGTGYQIFDKADCEVKDS